MIKLSKTILEDAEHIISRVDLSPLAGKWVSVTGATGIIGTYVLACLKVFGKCEAVRPCATRQPEEGHPSLEIFPDIWGWSKLDLSSHSEGGPPAEFMLYAAGYGQPAKFTAKPLTTIGINTIGLMNTLRGLFPNGRLLYISSSEVYSGNTSPQHEEWMTGTTTPQHPRACYIEAKRCGEAICNSFNQTTKNSAKAVVARVALSYGPGTRKNDDRVINQFIQQALLNGEIRMKDGGDAVRTYCYIADCVEMLFKAWLYGQEPVYNVGGCSRLTIRELAQNIGDYLNVPVYAPDGEDNGESPQSVGMDLRRMRVELGLPNFSPMKTGLARTIEWQKKLYGKI